MTTQTALPPDMVAQIPDGAVVTFLSDEEAEALISSGAIVEQAPDGDLASDAAGTEAQA